MIEKFNGIFYLILFSIHFLGLGFYAYQMIIDNKRYREKFIFSPMEQVHFQY